MPVEQCLLPFCVTPYGDALGHPWTRLAAARGQLESPTVQAALLLGLGVVVP